MKLKSPFSVLTSKAKLLLPNLINGAGFIKRVKMVKTVYDLCQPSMFTMTFPAKQGSRFFFPLSNLSLCDGKHERDLV